MKRTHIGVVCAIACVLAPCLVFSDTVMGLSYFTGDFDNPTVFFPMRAMQRRMFETGVFHLWNPYLFCGMPLDGNIISSLFYPLNWIFFVVPTAYAFNVFYLVHYALAAWFAFRLARMYGVSEEGAFVSGLAYALSGFTIVVAEVPVILGILPWVPAMLLYTELGWTLSGAARRRAFWLAAGATGMQFLSGYPQGSVYVGLFYGLYMLGRWGLASPRRWPDAAWIATVPLCGGLLGAVTLAPFVEMIGFTMRTTSNTASFVASNMWDTASVWRAFLPQYWGLGDIRPPYFGIGVLVLALGALAVRQGAVRWTAGLAAVTFVLSLGGPLMAAMPVLKAFRSPFRLGMMTGLAVAILAGFGYDRWLSGRKGRALVLVLCVIELGVLARSHFIVGPWPSWLLQCPAFLQPAAGQTPPTRVVTVPSGDVAVPIQRNYANLGMRWQYANLIGIDAMAMRGYLTALWLNQFHRPMETEERDKLMSLHHSLPLVTNQDSQLMKLLGADYTIESRDGAPALLPRPPHLPRALWVPTFRVAPFEAQVELLATNQVDASRVVLFAVEPALAGGRAESRGAAELRSWSPDVLVLSTKADDAGFLVLAEVWYPGWEATVDGQPAPVLQADAVLRAVPLPAGAHEVTLRYRPRAVRYGAVVSLTVLVIGLLALGWRR